jgi:hypothetical protein
MVGIDDFPSYGIGSGGAFPTFFCRPEPLLE